MDDTPTIRIVDHGREPLTNGEVEVILSPPEWEAFCKALHARPRIIPALRKLLTEAGVFDERGEAAAQ
jgi:hypothetical protein